MEVELRAKLKNTLNIKKKILVLFRNSQPKKICQKDIYLKHRKDKQRLLIFRTRETNSKSFLTIKTKNRSGKDHAWNEFECEIKNPQELRNILLNNGFEKVISLTKNRWQWKTKDFEINIDRIKELGDFIEIEININAKYQNQALKKIEALFKNLGINKKDILHEGYVQLALKK